MSTARALGVLLLATCGCSGRALGSTDVDGSSEGAASTSASTTSAITAGTSSTSTSTSTTADPGTTAADESSTGCEPIDPDESLRGCDVFAPDCPCGTKCLPWANDGGTALNATKCSPIDPDPDGLGEACVVEGSWLSGIDSCEAGLLCWHVDQWTNLGTCVEMCTGSLDEPLCADASKSCVTYYAGLLALCMTPCHPLDGQPCGPGQGCNPLGDTFVCRPDVSGTGGAYGEACIEDIHCDPGLFCTYDSEVPGCSDNRCCSPFCDLSIMDETQCPGFAAGQTCMPWDWGETTDLPGFENVGGCEVP